MHGLVDILSFSTSDNSSPTHVGGLHRIATAMRHPTTDGMPTNKRHPPTDKAPLAKRTSMLAMWVMLRALVLRELDFGKGMSGTDKPKASTRLSHPSVTVCT